MSEITWHYKAGETYERSVLLSDVRAGFGKHKAFVALRQVDDTSVGHILLDEAEAQKCRIAIDNDLPAYGLMVEGAQTVDANPMLILSGDVRDWQQDFGVFICSHELTHIYQNKHEVLRSPPVYGLEYEESSLSRGKKVTALMAEAVLSERMADIVAMYAVCEYAQNHPDSKALELLEGIGELSSLFAGIVQKDEGRYRPETVSRLMAPSGFNNREWDYYAAYSQHLPSDCQDMSSVFGRHSLADYQHFCKAQKDVVQSVLSMAP